MKNVNVKNCGGSGIEILGANADLVDVRVVDNGRSGVSAMRNPHHQERSMMYTDSVSSHITMMGANTFVFQNGNGPGSTSWGLQASSGCSIDLIDIQKETVIRNNGSWLNRRDCLGQIYEKSSGEGQGPKAVGETWVPPPPIPRWELGTDWSNLLY